MNHAKYMLQYQECQSKISFQLTLLGHFISGALTSAGVGNVKFLIVAVDYFSKWVEAEPVARIREFDVKVFIWKSLIMRFGYPRSIVFDHGRQFDSNKLFDWLKKKGIHPSYASVAHPQSNG